MRLQNALRYILHASDISTLTDVSPYDKISAEGLPDAAVELISA